MRRLIYALILSCGVFTLEQKCVNAYANCWCVIGSKIEPDTVPVDCDADCNPIKNNWISKCNATYGEQKWDLNVNQSCEDCRDWFCIGKETGL